MNLQGMREDKRFPGVLIHESSYVDDSCTIGAGTRIWHFSHIISGSDIGAGCSIGQNVMIGPNVQIGEKCRVQNNVSLYEGVILENEVFCGPSAVFTNVINPRAAVPRQREFQMTRVRTGATVGANATILCGTELGSFSFVAAGSVVTEDVAPFALVIGVPAKRVGWMSAAGARLNDELTCPIDGTKYRLNADGHLEITSS